MAAYADPSSPADLVRQAMYGGEKEYSRGAKDTFGLGSGMQSDGDTLQSASASLRDQSISVTPYFDEELGMVIGESTDLQISQAPKKRVTAKAPAPVQRSAPRPPPEAPAAPKRQDMFGIGLKVADDPPHKILSVNNLRDNYDRSINHLVDPNDILEAVDGNPVGHLSIDELETYVFGPKHSMAELALRKPDGQGYSVQAQRHIHVQFALGMSITTEPPHYVMRVDELLDQQNNNVSHMVQPGDMVEKVDGTFVEQLPMKRLEAIIFGPIDSTVVVTFKKAQTGKMYNLAVKRHVPVVCWLRWEEQGGMAMQAPPSVNNAPPPPAPFVEHAPPPPPPARPDPAFIPPPPAPGNDMYGFGDTEVTGEFI
eukprot:CAMPEP_0181315306 /NCGR_PEP_ID=MMETSP1101-20121128/15303_1 /TAXON_ID=46948 /ORGANISM="Rhodomonas abbreviata, Strain Caron Lab Isolate" /LENGTH=367 /DNA_ID=CAMNT_0023422501 /DNA_START=9 /DNA_END=1112 /DNA_ORIENTATION=+